MINLIPRINGSICAENSVCKLPECIGIAYNGFENWCTAAFLQRMGVDACVGDFLQLERDATLPQEHYQLNVTEKGIKIVAADEKGVIWALTTLAELARDGCVPFCTIEDGPKYRHRGLSLDCARHFFPAAEVKKIIEEISLTKLNVLKWHLTDDQGWRIESKRFPRLHEVSGQFYTQEEIRDVVEFARIRGVEIIPEIELPGHVSALLAAYPQYSCSGKEVKLATGGGIYPIVLCPGKDEVFAFLSELLEEVAGLFPGPRFHIGGDETPKGEWKKCPHCQARMEALGLTDYEDLQGWFAAQAGKILKKQGKTAICWNETLRNSTHPMDIQIQYWTLNHRISMEEFANAGGKWIYSDMFELYLDYPYAMTPLKKVYETQPHLGERDIGTMENLLGLEACIWAEHIRENEKLEQLLFPRIQAFAEVCWSGAGEYDDFLYRLKATMAGIHHRDISYKAEEGWNPQGHARQREAFGYMAGLRSGMSEEVREQTVEASAPSPEFGRAFMTKFFQPEDIPLLMGGTK